ncbi:hypothetical protein JCM5353_008873 [Sporobolomyces roseus]
MERDQRLEWQQELDQIMRTILNDPEAKSRESVFEGWRKRMMAHFNVGNRAVVVKSTLPDTIRTLEDFNLVKSRLVELEKALHNPQSTLLKYLHQNEPAGRGRNSRSRAQAKMPLPARYESRGIFMALADSFLNGGDHKNAVDDLVAGLGNTNLEDLSAQRRRSPSTELANVTGTLSRSYLSRSLRHVGLSDRKREMYGI